MNTNRKLRSIKEAIATTCMSTQRVWKPIRIQDQSKPKSNTWKLSKLKAYWASTIKNSTNVFKLGDYAQFIAHHVSLLKYQYWYRLQTDSILLKYSVEVVKAGVQYFTWSYWIIRSCSRLTQPNPWVKPTHVHVWVSLQHATSSHVPASAF